MTNKEAAVKLREMYDLNNHGIRSCNYEALSMAIDLLESEDAKLKEAELKSCPFCGGQAVLVHNGAWNIYGHCRKCGAEGAFFEDDIDGIGKQEAIEAWNHRA